MDPLARALRFSWSVDDAASDEVLPIAEGTVLRTPTYPDAWSVNALRLEHALPSLDLAAVERLGAEYLTTPYLHVLVEEESTAVRLFDAAREAGWKTERELVMGLERVPEDPGSDQVREGALDEVLGLMRRWLTEEGHPPGTVDQIVDRSRREHAAVPERLVVADRAGVPAAMATVRLGGDVAQVEDVYAVPAARGTGLGRAVTATAARIAADSGAELVYIVADDQDWPKELYRRLGFEELGLVYEFLLARGTKN